jgi:quercetin dioxygenase-like cupin family protein
MTEDVERAQPFLLHEDEGDAFWFLGSLATVKVPSRLTRGQLSLVEFLNPPGFATPLHRHGQEDEAFYILSGTAEFRCDGQTLRGGPGDFLFLPVGLPHAYAVGPDEPLRCLTLTGAPTGFDSFVQQAGEPASDRRLPDPAPFDPEALGHAAAQHGIEILGPPPVG